MPLHWVAAPSGAHAAVSSNASCSGAPPDARSRRLPRVQQRSRGDASSSSDARSASPSARDAARAGGTGGPERRAAARPSGSTGRQQHHAQDRGARQVRRGTAAVQGRDGSSSRAHPCAAAVACSYSRGWSMAVGARQGRGGSSSRPHPWPTARGMAACSYSRGRCGRGKRGIRRGAHGWRNSSPRWPRGSPWRRGRPAAGRIGRGRRGDPFP